MKFLIFIFLLLCLKVGFSAPVYETKDDKGNIIYSDAPQDPKSQLINLPRNNQFSSKAAKEVAAEDTTTPNNSEEISPQDAFMGYKSFEILSPINEESIQNQPALNVTVFTNPSLQKGHSVQIFIDGMPLGQAASTTNFTFPTPQRGTHSLSAKLYNNDKQVLKETSRITIYVHQVHR